MRDVSDLYYECHITIAPPENSRKLQDLQDMAQHYDFRVADFAMLVNEEIPKAFISARDESYSRLVKRMIAVIKVLQLDNFKVLRYKIEDTILDSRHTDFLELI